MFEMCDAKFEGLVHHGEQFEENGAFKYSGGKTTTWSYDPD